MGRGQALCSAEPSVQGVAVGVGRLFYLGCSKPVPAVHQIAPMFLTLAPQLLMGWQNFQKVFGVAA